MNQEAYEFSKIIWEYHHLNQKIENSDIILVLGSHDMRVAEYGAELFLKGYAPEILFSGGLGSNTLTDPLFTGTTEADLFSKIAIQMGVPKEKIIIENKATNTGENIRFGYELIKHKHINRIILVQKPFMERRTYATFLKQRPGKKIAFSVTSPQIAFEDYFNEKETFEKITNIMVGDLQRIEAYPKLGFQIEQEIPENVRESYKKLVELGYDKGLLK